MDGQPVWLASISRRDRRGALVATGRWSAPDVAAARSRLERALWGVGDESRQRLFRMNITLCLHRAPTDEEVAGLPDWWHAAPATDLAGGPIEVLWESTPGAASTRPCLAPRRGLFPGAPPDLWVPLDCGRCPPCRARAAVPSYRGAGVRV
jgi:hypothetical protein